VPKAASRNTAWLIAASCLLALVSVIAIVLLWTPGFSGNDDAFLGSLPSGSFSGTPEGFMGIHVGPLNGTILAIFYSVTQALPWYTLMEFAIVWLALAILLTVSVVLGRESIIPPIFIAGLLWLYIAAPKLLEIAMTPVALIGMSSGMTLVLLAKKSPKFGVPITIVAGLIVGFSGVLRQDLIISGLLLTFLPFLIFLALQLRVKLSLCFFGVLSIISIANWAIRSVFVNDSLWAAYFSSEKSRYTLLDTPQIQASFQLVDSTPFTLNDLYLYYQHGMLDRHVFSPQKLEALTQVTSGATKNGAGLIYEPLAMWESFQDNLLPATAFLGVLAILVLVGLINLGSWRQRAIFVVMTLVSVAWFAAAFHYVGETRKIGAHVQIPLTFLALSLTLFSPLAFGTGRKHLDFRGLRGKARYLAAGVAPAIAVFVLQGDPLDDLAATSKKNQAVMKIANEFVAEVRSLEPGVVYLSICCTTPWEGADPLKPKPFESWPMQIVGGWPTHTAGWERRNEMLGISDGVPKDAYGTTDLVQALISNPKVRLIATEQAAGALSGQMKQYRGWQGCLNPIHRLPNDAVVYQAIAGNCATAPPAA